ncbi:MAG: rhodanese-like domain-containing protein [Verrucomicrobiota bacterium]
MRAIIPALLTLTLGITATLADEGNPRIDYEKFLSEAKRLQSVREANRVSEDEFLGMAKEANTVILDTRSKTKFDRIHVEGAIHLNFSDFSDASLAKLIPNKTTRILIYCNNNFDNEPASFPAKRAEVALNVPTFINLHAYGYENVHELKPLLDIHTTRIPMAGSAVLMKK